MKTNLCKGELLERLADVKTALAKVSPPEAIKSQPLTKAERNRRELVSHSDAIADRSQRGVGQTFSKRFLPCVPAVALAQSRSG